MNRYFGRVKSSAFILSVSFTLLTLLNACLPVLLRNQVGNEKSVIINGTEVPPVADLIPENVREGEQLYKEFCASCHGIDLKGAVNWKTTLDDGSLPPPPQDSSGHTWHHSDTVLERIILEGGFKLYGGTMPAFGDDLTKEQAVLILDFFKSNWEKDEREFQWWITITEKK